MQDSAYRSWQFRMWNNSFNRSNIKYNLRHRRKAYQQQQHAQCNPTKWQLCVAGKSFSRCCKFRKERGKVKDPLYLANVVRTILNSSRKQEKR